jgi:hypothetical protein
MLVKLFTIIILFSDILLPCAVCYGNPESLMTKGMNMGVVTLLGFIGFVLSIVLYSIISISLRTKNIKKLEG